MMEAIKTVQKEQLKKVPEMRPGDTVRVHQKIKEKDKERIQVFEGTVIALRGGRGLDGMVTVRKIASGVGVERIFPIHSPRIEKIERVKSSKVRRAKLYYVREKSKKEAIREQEDVFEEMMEGAEVEAGAKAAEAEDEKVEAAEETGAELKEKEQAAGKKEGENKGKAETGKTAEAKKEESSGEKPKEQSESQEENKGKAEPEKSKV